MSGRILIVDDNPLNIKLLAARLTREYYTVVTATGGREALDIAAQDPPDIILLDVMMPEMDGFEVCESLQKNPVTSHIPVVMVTALTDNADRVRGLEAGAADFLSKPINDMALLARVRSLLRLKLIMDEWRLRESTSKQMGVTQETLRELDISDANIILLEDDQLDNTLITNTLADLPATTRCVQNVAAAQQMAADGACDLVIVSLNLNTDDGLRLCPVLRSQETTRHVPILLLAHQSDIGKVAKGLDLGANDYLLRPIEVNELTARVRTQLRHKRSYDKLKSNYQNSLSMALTDPLTGAFNRRYLDHHLPQLIEHCQSTHKPLSLLLVDADHFKSVNDKYGHQAGDEVLKEVVLRVTNGVRAVDFVARYGGEEFAVVLPETDLQTARAIADRLRARIADQPVTLPETAGSINVTVSIGLAYIKDDQDTQATLVARADEAVYKAKQTGRNRLIVAEA
ncbi:MAG: PleD family two-component system response regulator [Alphaproteobacteria bacterium]|nr:PleD family two-component system response regulator [Alphaproteobacteria bacterium]